MPKRRMTAARKLQIMQWQVAGRRSRARRSIDNYIWATGRKPHPTGKKTLLYHRTDNVSAKAIIKTRKWKSGRVRFGGLPGRSWFSTKKPVSESYYYGGATLSVKVPRKAVRSENYRQPGGAEFVSVSNKDLYGVPVKRVR